MKHNLNPWFCRTPVNFVIRDITEKDFVGELKTALDSKEQKTTLPRHLNTSQKVMALAARLNPKFLTLCDESLSNNKDFALLVLSRSEKSKVPFCYYYLHPSLKADKNVSLAAVNFNFEAIQFLSESLHEDLEIGKAAVIEICKDQKASLSPLSVKSFQILSSKMLRKPEIAEFILNQPDTDITMLPLFYLDDKKMVEISLEQPGAYLGSVNQKFWADFEVVLKAVKNDSSALAHASKELQDNEDIVIKSITHWPTSLKDASPRLKARKDIVEIALARNVAVFSFVAPELQDDFEFVKKVVSRAGRMLEFASNRLRDDEDIVLAAVTENGRALEWASEKIRHNPKIYKRAIKQDNAAIFFTEPPVCFNANLLIKAIRNNLFIGENMIHNSRINSQLVDFLKNMTEGGDASVYPGNQNLLSGLERAAAKQDADSTHKMLQKMKKHHYKQKNPLKPSENPDERTRSQVTAMKLYKKNRI